MAIAAPHVDQGPPSCVARCERLSHDQAEPSVASVAASNLRRESQKLLVDEALRVKVTQQPRPSFEEEQLTGAHLTHLFKDGVRRNRPRTATNRANLDRIGHALLAQS